jgi:hypothetical protein
LPHSLSPFSTLSKSLFGCYLHAVTNTP